MNETNKITRVPSLKTVQEFRQYVTELGINLPCEDAIIAGPTSPLLQPIPQVTVNGKKIGNRYAVQPMEGWDGTTSGGATPEVERRWQRFGLSGAKMIWGGEAMAVCAEARANPNQLMIVPETEKDLTRLRNILVDAHRERFGKTDDLVIGFQLTHSGRFCKPTDKARMEPRVAYRHPILDRKFKVASDDLIVTDARIETLIQQFVDAARIAWNAGADFVDIKHCHGYLLHELLSAYTRPGPYGGSFENRTRILREIVSGIRASGNKIGIGVRLSAFDTVPFKPDPARSQPGKLGPGIPEDFSACLPYKYGFGVNQDNPLEYDLTETIRFIELCAELGINLINLTAGSPYYTHHIQRPALYPPSDGYQPPHDPLIDVARQINAVREIKAKVPASVAVVGTGYSYLQEYLPQVAQYVLRHEWADMVGLGRAVLSYPTMLADATQQGSLNPKFICRTFSDCTTGPRNGLVSGCYPLDKFYTDKPEFLQLREAKKRMGG